MLTHVQRRSLIYSKKFFWLGDQSIESHHLSDYLRIEKPEIAHQNVAHATQTGRGLLFFAKRAEDKSNPAGILNLVSNKRSRAGSGQKLMMQIIELERGI